jgi:uncharacterized membrane protein
MSVHRPNFLATLARIVVLTVLATALSFAVTLLVSIVSLALASAIRHTAVDMSVAYRVIGVRAVMVAAPLALLIIGTVEMRSYLRARNEARPLKFVNQ